MDKKFTRTIKLTDPIIEYGKQGKDKSISDEDILHKTIIPTKMNCHNGSLKLHYSEMEFLTIVSKHLDLNECLVVYVGAKPGYRLKHLMIKEFFPKMKMLLYDPEDFDIEPTDNIIIKTGTEGWFVDETVNEVIKIANGRKIIYISDIRLDDDDKYVRQNNIYEDMQKQQKWGVMMDAEFMLLKFRMFYYEDNPNNVEENFRIDFINNNLFLDYSKNLLYKINKKKQRDNENWMIYLQGKLYTQIYAKERSTECRLLVKKIKYYKNADKYKNYDQEKYKMRYYNNLTCEGIFNYFNIITRNKSTHYKKSKNIAKILPGSLNSHSLASEYYVVRKYLKTINKKCSFSKIAETIFKIHTFFNNRYGTKTVTCGIIKNFFYKRSNRPEEPVYFENREYDYDYVVSVLKKKILETVDMINKQLKNFEETENLSNIVKKEFIQSIDKQNKIYYILTNKDKNQKYKFVLKFKF